MSGGVPGKNVIHPDANLLLLGVRTLGRPGMHAHYATRPILSRAREGSGRVVGGSRGCGQRAPWMVVSKFSDSRLLLHIKFTLRDRAPRSPPQDRRLG